MIKCDTVENYIHNAMEEWLEAYILQINSAQQPVIDPIESSLETVREQIAALQQQQNAGDEKKKPTLQIIPTTQHILDNYHILTISEKN